MALVHKNFVKETRTTTGTGTYTLGGAVGGFQSFAAIGNTNTCYYSATDGVNWEVGIGTYTLSGTTLARTTILARSNSGAAVSWSAGTRYIACCSPAERYIGSDQPGRYINWLLNGDLEVWQRGAGGSASIAIAASANGYGPDRWTLTTGANEACHMNQVVGLTNGSQWAAKVIRDSGQTGTTVITFEQPLNLNEISALRGRFVTLSFVAKAGANYSPTSSNLVVNVYCGTGAAARRGTTGYTTETTPISLTQVITTSAVLYTAVSTVIIPTTTNQMTVSFQMTPVGTAGADDSFTVDEVQLQVGTATAFERRPFFYDIQMCQRYYWKTFAYSTAPVQNVASTTGAVFVRLPTGASGTLECG